MLHFEENIFILKRHDKLCSGGFIDMLYMLLTTGRDDRVYVFLIVSSSLGLTRMFIFLVTECSTPAAAAAAVAKSSQAVPVGAASNPAAGVDRTGNLEIIVGILMEENDVLKRRVQELEEENRTLRRRAWAMEKDGGKLLLVLPRPV